MKAAPFSNNFAQYAIIYWRNTKLILIWYLFLAFLLYLNTDILYMSLNMIILEIIEWEYVFLSLRRKLSIWSKVWWTLREIVKCSCLNTKRQIAVTILIYLRPLTHRPTNNLMLLDLMGVCRAFCSWYRSSFF